MNSRNPLLKVSKAMVQPSVELLKIKKNVPGLLQINIIIISQLNFFAIYVWYSRDLMPYKCQFHVRIYCYKFCLLT